MMERTYNHTLSEHLCQNRQMVFLVGPRQVGKTTLCRELCPDENYFNWDNQDHRSMIIDGPARIAEIIGLDRLAENIPVAVFDEIHKYSRWKDFLKGFFDVYESRTKIIVTGSSKLDSYSKGGDSLMGRYFLYHLHPLSVREIIAPRLKDLELQTPQKIDAQTYDDLFAFGGFPEPLSRSNKRFSNRWNRLRQQQLFNEDIRDLTQVQEIHQLEFMAEMLKHQTGQLINYSNLAKRVRISVDTVRRWTVILNSLYYCFMIQPWYKNVPRSLLKQPKIYLWDWSQITDPGARVENFIASHLMKAVHWWTDNGFGTYGLFFLRDKDKREVDFLVVRNEMPWFLIESKTGDRKSISKNLSYFQNTLDAPHAFQVLFSMDYVEADCFASHNPMIVPAKTFLSQLV